MTNSLKTLINREVASLFEQFFIKETFRGFNFNKFKSLTDKEDMVGYAEKFLPLLGEGSSRMVFGLGSGKVLKIWYSNQVWNNQNKMEIEVHERHKKHGYLARIFGWDKENFNWIVAEAVQVIADNSQLLSKFNINEDDFILYFRIMRRNPRLSFEELLEMVFSKEANEDLENQTSITIDQMNENDLELLKKAFWANLDRIEDIETFDHWGVTSNGNIVVVDYAVVGFDELFD